jgi:hypothetical protein
MSPKTGSTGLGGPRAVAAIVAAGVLIGAGMFALGQVGLASAVPSGNVAICHATASSSNPYTTQSVSTSSVNNLFGNNGHGTHEDDIIPPFTDESGTSFPGMNWSPTGQSIWNNGCEIPVPGYIL